MASSAIRKVIAAENFNVVVTTRTRQRTLCRKVHRYERLRHLVASGGPRPDQMTAITGQLMFVVAKIDVKRLRPDWRGRDASTGFMANTA